MNSQRVLAIAPCAQGFGFAVLEGPKRLIDYGVKEVRGDKNSGCLKKVIALIRHYQPNVIVLEDPLGKGSQRCLRIQILLREIVEVALSKNVESRSFSRSEIRKAFSKRGIFTKHQLASSIAKQFPELALRLPPVRKPWMSEDERMSIFDAVGMAFTFLLNQNAEAWYPPR